ncbi:MAG: fatty acid--CoA ligase family protein [Pirellulales bacterium]|nr:fatty acid--CoA ligase family protein [Pirellulales bacterium]
MPGWLLDRLREFGDQPAMIGHGGSSTYCALVAEIEHWQAEIKALGIAPAECVALVGEYSPHTAGLVVALILNRNILVPLSNDSAPRHERSFEVARVDVVLRVAEDGSHTIQRRTPTDRHELIERLRAAQEPGLILFTSGSTGESKATLLSFARLLERFEKRRKAFRTLIFMKLDHIGGINTLFHILCDGGALVSIAERTPRAVCDAIAAHRVQLLPTTPTFLNMLLISGVYKDYDLSSLELISYGTEPMPESTLKSLNRTFPGVKLKQTYGLSELGILQTQSRDSSSLWVKVGGEGYETKIVDGILWIRARAAMLGYLNAPSPFDTEGWFNTGDAVDVDGEFLRIRGRLSEIINVGGEKVHPAEVESVLLRVANIREATVWGKPNAVMGHVVVATVSLIEPEDRFAMMDRVLAYCRDKLEPFKVPMMIEVDEEDHHNARFKKIRSKAKTRSGGQS